MIFIKFQSNTSIRFKADTFRAFKEIAYYKKINENYLTDAFKQAALLQPLVFHLEDKLYIFR